MIAYVTLLYSFAKFINFLACFCTYLVYDFSASVRVFGVEWKFPMESVLFKLFFCSLLRPHVYMSDLSFSPGCFLVKHKIRSKLIFFDHVVYEHDVENVWYFFLFKINKILPTKHTHTHTNTYRKRENQTYNEKV